MSDLRQYLSAVDVMARLSLKADSQRYFLGYAWWVLEPLLWVGVFYLVFAVLLPGGRGNFLEFLLVGKLTFVWFSKSVSQCANSLMVNRGLIGNLDLPKWLFPLAICHEGLFKQIAVFALLFFALLMLQVPVSWTWLWVLPIALIQYLFIVSVGLLAAVLICIRQDFNLIVQIGLVFLMFVSGVFWDVAQIPDPNTRALLFQFNPMASVVDLYRHVLLEGSPPELERIMMLLGKGLGLTVAMMLIYRRATRWISFRVVTQ